MRHAIPLTDNSFGRERRIIAISYQGGQRRLNLLTRSTVSQLSSLFFSTLDFSFEITGIHRGLVLPRKLDNKLPGWPRGPEETPGRRHRSKDLRSPTESERFVCDLWRPVHEEMLHGRTEENGKSFPISFSSAFLYFINKTRIIFMCHDD